MSDAFPKWERPDWNGEREESLTDNLAVYHDARGMRFRFEELPMCSFWRTPSQCERNYPRTCQGEYPRSCMHRCYPIVTAAEMKSAVKMAIKHPHTFVGYEILIGKGLWIVQVQPIEITDFGVCRLT